MHKKIKHPASQRRAQPATSQPAAQASLRQPDSARASHQPHQPAPAAPAATIAYTNNLVTVTATSADPNATLQLNLNGGVFNLLTSGAASAPQTLKLVPPTNTLTVWVTAPDGATSNLYTVNVMLQPSLAAFQMTNKVTTGQNLTLSWPSDHTGWRLQVQTNNLTTGLGSNWFIIFGSTSTNQVVQPISPNNGSVFYRLAY